MARAPSLTLTVACSLLQLAAVNGARSMEKVHVASPEAEVFLKLAMRAANAFTREHRRCPSSWGEMDITYANGPYRITDPDIRPRPADGATWRPRASNYDYVLEVRQDGKACRVLAVNAHRDVELTIESGMDSPLPPKVPQKR